jgi:DNA-binding PadR family transcriptional regulator
MPHHHHHHHHEHHDHHQRHAGPSHRGGGPNGAHPGRGHGRGPGGFGFDDEGRMPRGRKLSSDDLQLLLLALIADQPSHGYELIKALETRSNGFYVPSPGMMYPALACMEDRGHVGIQLEGNRKRYTLSDEGRAHLEANRERADAMLAKLAHMAEKMARMRSAMEGEGEGWSAEFDAARHALRHALHARAGAAPEEQQRIAAILARAAADIENGAAKA